MATARSARPASASARQTDDYSDLASLPTPNKDKFGTGRVPGEIQAGSLPKSLPKQYLQYIISSEGGRTIASTAHGDLFEVPSRRQRQEQREEEEADSDNGAYPPFAKISIEGSRTMLCKRTQSFVCDGTMYRHTDVSWKDAPIEFKQQHSVEAKEGAPAESESVCYEHKIEDLMPFDCHVYWKTVWEKCKSCHKADQAFKCWAMRASTPVGKVASKKRKADEIAAPASSSAESEEADGEEDSQGETKVRKGNLKSD